MHFLYKVYLMPIALVYIFFASVTLWPILTLLITTRWKKAKKILDKAMESGTISSYGGLDKKTKVKFYPTKELWYYGIFDVPPTALPIVAILSAVTLGKGWKDVTSYPGMKSLSTSLPTWILINSCLLSTIGKFVWYLRLKKLTVKFVAECKDKINHNVARELCRRYKYISVYALWNITLMTWFYNLFVGGVIVILFVLVFYLVNDVSLLKTKYYYNVITILVSLGILINSILIGLWFSRRRYVCSSNIHHKSIIKYLIAAVVSIHTLMASGVIYEYLVKP